MSEEKKSTPVPLACKCNLFVADMNRGIGASTPNNVVNGKKSPWLATANTWGDEKYVLLGNYLEEPESFAAAGDIVSFRKLNGHSGHVGINTGGITINSNGYHSSGEAFIAAGKNEVNVQSMTTWKNKADHAAPVFRLGE